MAESVESASQANSIRSDLADVAGAPTAAAVGARLFNLKLPLGIDVDPPRHERHSSPVIRRDGVGLSRPGVGTFFAFGRLRIINILLHSGWPVNAERLPRRGVPSFRSATLVIEDSNPGPELVCPYPMAARIYITRIAIDLLSGVKEGAMGDPHVVEISLDRPPWR